MVSDQAAKVLMVIGEEGKVTPKPVQLGTLIGNDMRVIRGGIEPSDEVIVEGLLKARPGTAVRTETYNADAGE